MINVGDNSIDNILVGDTQVERVYLGTDIVWEYSQPTIKKYLTFIALESGTFKFNGNPINYSIDNGRTWVSLASNTDSPTISAGDKILWKASGLTRTANNGMGKFSSTGNFNVEGNIMSLEFSDEFKNKDTLNAKWAFRNLFSGCTHLISAENLLLPAKTFTQGWPYAFMFEGCTSLTIGPSELPSTTLTEYCYQSMFNGCTSLTTAPELPATTLADHCYYYMFAECTSLTVAPELPATTLAGYCYQYMFNNCTSLTTTPELPATTLEQRCYGYMFYGCTSLTTASALSATTLAQNCCSYMFAHCTSLTTAPELSATTLASYCYTYMFYDCTSLNYIKAMFTTTPAQLYTNNWVNGVASSGTFVKNSAATWTATGVNSVPTGWTVQTASS